MIRTRRRLSFLMLALFLMLCLFSMVPVMAAEKNQMEIKIGIIGAMESEVNSLKEAMYVTRRETKAGMEFCEGNYGTMKAVVVQSGMGKVHAAICAQILVDDFAVTHIINTGVAGSLNEKLDIGDILVSVDAVQHDFTVEAIGFKKGEIPYTGQVAFAADKELRQKAVQAVRTVLSQVRAVEGRVCSGDQFVSSQKAKNRIISEGRGLRPPEGQEHRVQIRFWTLGGSAFESCFCVLKLCGPGQVSSHLVLPFPSVMCGS